MQRFIILFRGVNVGGNNLLPMKLLVPLLQRHGYRDVSWYIQSGNLVLSSDTDPEQNIQHLVFEQFGFSPEVFAIKRDDFCRAVATNPFSEHDGKLVHLFFCQQTIKLDEAAITQYLADTESYTVDSNVFYLHAPDGIGRSKLVARITQVLGQTATARNLNTVNKLLAMLNNE